MPDPEDTTKALEMPRLGREHIRLVAPGPTRVGGLMTAITGRGFRQLEECALAASANSEVSQKNATELNAFGLSRRNLLFASAVATISASLSTVFLGGTTAHGAIVWGHPFTFYSGRSRGFTGQWPDGHAGIDYTPGAGTPIHAVADGYISYSVPDHSNYGQVVFIDHGGGYTSRYAHMQAGSRVSGGQNVARGTYLGRVGNTGHSFGAHLHVEVLQGSTALNPDPLIDRNKTAPLAGTNPPEVDLTPAESAALFEIRDKLEQIRAALLDGRPDYYGGQYRTVDMLLSHSMQTLNLSQETKTRVRGSDPNVDMLQAILAKVSTQS